MKKFLLITVVILAGTFFCFAEKPADGFYILEILGSPETFDLEIRGDEWIVNFSDEYNATSVTYNEQNSTIKIPVLGELCDTFHYEINEDYIDLFFTGNINSSFSSSFTGLFDGMKYANSVSADAVAIIERELMKIFYSMPIIRLIHKLPVQDY